MTQRNRNVRFLSGALLAAVHVTSLAQEIPVSELPFNPEFGVTADLLSGQVRILEGMAADFTEWLGGSGTGELSVVPLIPFGAVESTASEELFYAPYELRGHPLNSLEDFVPFTVNGDDSREDPVQSTVDFPARAIAHISFMLGSTGLTKACSGAMVAEDLVLTAGHCVVMNGDWNSEFVIRPGRNGGSEPFGQCGATSVFTLLGWYMPADDADYRLFDLALLKLDCDVGARTGWFAIESAPESWRRLTTRVQGYDCKKIPFRKQWTSDDRVRLHNDLKIFYLNDTGGCTSGSPVLLGADNSTLYAVHTNGRHGSAPWSDYNAATRITKERLQRVIAWVESFDQ